MSIKWDSKILLVKVEDTYGVDAAPTGALNAILATQVVFSPMEGSEVDRDLETPYMGASGTIPTELHAKLSFRVELVGSGTAGTAPAYGPLLRGCACAETIVANTSVTYNPVSDDHESVTAYLWIGDTQFVTKGVRGNAKFDVNAQGIPYIEFEFTGLFQQPSEQTRLTPDLTAFQKPIVASQRNTPTFTVGGNALVMRSFMLDMGNEVEPDFLINEEDIDIGDRSDVLDIAVRAVPLTTFNPFQLAEDQQTVAVVLSHGTEAGKIATINVPSAEVQRQGIEEVKNRVQWPMRLIPLPVAGNDQWTLTLT